ncbi:hypothetical protein [Anoxybacteroides amylolyticum]|uniref:Uncharacterized protein n=1 Tax=Anoxybacteroides amylolyticum TaxID=294699 RepID=A0A160F5C9_9BACL|nr:hypothetical protein [Anoxybacillus amylolyticus]ANB61331.1 hypothetical protein GFC30_1675 [Anoxybacillus amylolyticus]
MGAYEINGIFLVVFIYWQLYKLKFCFTFSRALTTLYHIGLYLDENGNEKSEILYCNLYRLELDEAKQRLLLGFFEI